MNMKRNITNRGFGIYKFEDCYQETCTLQESSSANEARIWLGIHNSVPKICEPGTGWRDIPLPEGTLLSGRMHLNVEQVKELLPLLQKFVETGGL